MGQAEERIKQFDEDLVQNHIEYLKGQENQVEETTRSVNVDQRVMPNEVVAGGNRYIIQGLIFLRDYKKKFLLSCNKQDTPATYKSIEEEINDIELLLASQREA